MNQPSSFRIVPATERDVPTILRMVRALADYEKVLHKVTATESNLRESLFGESHFAEAAIGYAAEEPAGIAVFFHTYSTFQGRPNLYIEDIFVEPRWRGRGLGKALMAYLAQVAVERGCARLEWSVLNWNEPAIRFYRTLGAQPVSDWTVYRVADDALVNLARQSGKA